MSEELENLRDKLLECESPSQVLSFIRQHDSDQDVLASIIYGLIETIDELQSPGDISYGD